MKKFSQLNKTKIKRVFEADEAQAQDAQGANLPQNTQGGYVPQGAQLQPEPLPAETNTGSVIGFFSKLFESREVSHIYHLQAKDNLTHITLEEYYDVVLDMIDDIIEAYQGQYCIVEGYDVIDTKEIVTKEPINYFEELAGFIKNERKCISEEDTHLHGSIDEILMLIYKTLYKLKNLK